MALWDIAGKASGVPVYKLLGGKVRDNVPVYLTNLHIQPVDNSPAAYGVVAEKVMAMSEGFSIVKQSIAFHSPMIRDVPGFFRGELRDGFSRPNRGPLTERGLEHIALCGEAMKRIDRACRAGSTRRHATRQLYRFRVSLRPP